jgi:FSR family fosmidomycin resistance protein-like MFS transporter
MPWLVIPGLAVLGGVLLRRVPPMDRLHESTTGGGLRALRPYAKPLSLLYAIVVLRTLAATSFSTFVPVMLTRRGMSIAQAGTVASVYLCAVGAGGFFGGPIADRFGARRVIMLSLVSAVPLLALTPLLSGWWLVATLAGGGLLLQSTLPVNVTFAQMIAPISAATVSSLMMGFAWGVGGLAAPLVGMTARSPRHRKDIDIDGIHAARRRRAGTAAACVARSARHPPSPRLRRPGRSRFGCRDIRERGYRCCSVGPG